MADSKKYDGSQWEHSLRKLTTATANIEPTIYSDGTAITSYTIKGNTTQSGTPTPSNPITISGVGNKTANLFNKQAVTNNERVVYTDGTTAPLTGVDVSDYIPLETGETYTLNISSSIVSKTGHLYAMYDSSKNFVNTGQHPSTGAIIYSFTVPNGVSFIRFNSLMTELDNVMLVKGSYTTQTFPSYEPYGYKIPISSGQTVNNYLGSIQSTRQIKKLVLTGGADETWNNAGNGTMYRSDISDYLKEAIVTSVCTHYPCNANVPSSTAAQYGVSFITSSSYNRLYIKDTAYSTATDFKAYLAAQYANGTPVTIWYVLATAETGIVNEPLMKIGDYSDSISNATPIPTTDGANSITVDTTVQPSEFTATWTGWHDASVQEYDGTNWQ